MQDDTELILRIRQGDVQAVEMLMEKYKGLVNKLSRVFFIKGGDIEDIAQEGMIALYNAVLTYNIQGNTAFTTYATSCIKNRIFDCIKSSNTQKHKALSDSVPMSVLDDKNMTGLSPEEITIDAEEKDYLHTVIDNTLNDTERTILYSYFEGKSYQSIADKIGKNTKYVDNALQKIRKKLKSALEK